MSIIGQLRSTINYKDKHTKNIQDQFTKDNLWNVIGMNSSAYDMLSISYYNGALVSKTFDDIVSGISILLMWIDKRKYYLDFIIDRFRDIMPDFEAIERQLKEGSKSTANSSLLDELEHNKDFSHLMTPTKQVESSNIDLRELFKASLADSHKEYIDPPRPKVTEEDILDIKARIRAEVYEDMKIRVYEEVEAQASRVTLNQIHKVEYHSKESFGEEIAEIKRIATKAAALAEKLEGKCNDYDTRIPSAENQIVAMRADVNGKTPRDDFLKLQSGVKDFVTKQEYEYYDEKLNSKASFQEINELNIKIEGISEKIKTKISQIEFNQYKEVVENKISAVSNLKLDKVTFLNYKDEVKQKETESNERYNKSQESMNGKFDSIQKQFRRVDNILENKSEKEVIFDIRNSIMDLAHKDKLEELENKILPILREIIGTTKSFDERISTIREQSLRIDELLLDTCSKYDLQKIYRLIDKMNEKERFDEFVVNQEKLNDNFLTKSTNTEAQVIGFIAFIEEAQTSIATIEESINELRAKQNEVVNMDEISKLEEMLVSKADRFELNHLFDVKSNKADLSSIVNVIDFVHKQLTYQTQITLSAVRNLTWSNEKSSDNSKFHSNILLNQATSVTNWICSSTVGDCVRAGKYEIPSELKGIDECERIMQNNFIKEKDKTDGNVRIRTSKNFAKRLKTESFTSPREQQSTREKMNTSHQMNTTTGYSMSGEALETNYTMPSFNSPRMDFRNLPKEGKEKLPYLK